MDHLFDAIILGTIQGLTEFLPVSSSGHLVLAHYFLGYDAGDSLIFDVALHIGTLLALVLFFWRDIVSLLTNWLKSLTVGVRQPAQQLPWLIILAGIPAAIAGALFDPFFASLRSPWIVVVTLIVFGLLFLVVERLGEKTKTMNNLHWSSALGIGLAQVLALVPGVSRSGVTIAAGMAAGFSRAEAARFSFLLSIPVVAGAAGKKMLDLKNHSLVADEKTAMVVGIAAAAIVGYVVIRFLLRYLANHRLDVFAYYRLALAELVLIALLKK